jgi:hypothetical protein
MKLVRFALWPVGAVRVAYVARVLAHTGNVWYYDGSGAAPITSRLLPASTIDWRTGRI